MKTSIYQCSCICDFTTIAENKIEVWVTDYASTRDFYGFEKLRSEELKSINLVIDIDLVKKQGAIYCDKIDSNPEPAIIWYAKDKIYVGLPYLKKYPLVIEIVPDNIWVKIFYNHSFNSLIDFVNSFKDKYDLGVQLSIATSLNRLNSNIVLGDTNAPFNVTRPYIY